MHEPEDLAQRQRRLLAAVKGRGADAGGFGAGELALLRETLLWWRRLGVTQACRFTATLLGTRHRLDDVVEAFVRETRGADSIETQRDLFLAHVARDSDPLCAAMAMTELALLARMAISDLPPRVIAWPRDPGPVLAALLRGQPPPDEVEEPFVVLVGPASGTGLEWHRATPWFRRYIAGAAQQALAHA